LSLRRKSDKEVEVSFDKEQGLLDRDFVLYYATGKDDVGLTALMHRPIPTQQGFFTLLITPKLSLSESTLPRDIVLVLDTSGSMRGKKIEQARRALKYCLNNLTPRDRFGLISFATVVNPYDEKLVEATPEQLNRARKWVDDLDATGGTAIQEALDAAIKMRPASDERPFTVVFFTDGEPTIGETDPEKILRSFAAKNTARTRVFTFGVGDEVNAALLDRLAEQTRALSTYVRPAEDIEAKVSGMFSKMANPVLTNLKLVTTGDVRLGEVYPPVLPDLFHGGQLVVMGRYDGKGAAAIKLTGKIGKATREFVYETRFAEKTDDSKEFVEQLWARRKVGFLLDQIRINGEKKELKDEVIALARRYGITTPYTSYLIVPDSVGTGPGRAPVAFRDGRGGRPAPGLAKKGPGGRVGRVNDFARGINAAPGDLARNRIGYERERYTSDKADPKVSADDRKALSAAYDKLDTYGKTYSAFKGKRKMEAQVGKLGVDVALQVRQLRSQAQLDLTAQRLINGRNLMEVGGVWVDEGFLAKTKAVTIRAQSDAYFQILRKQPQMKNVFQLGNYLVWVTPSGTALILDTSEGKTTITDAEIDKMFRRGS
jgi:Ca-activated chloride channel family protein